ncbi:hypothetical protein SUGI_0858930 [Cryptomeria japonica]|uniref:LOB domain-containing protein 29-like n=1 Tax=Cryptomeria japonica TaxID=3369 RepID=UPI002414B1FF|nr:LOB domain-containing protein 29-like [Cryptomeria japonica]GLJ41492.1 hypothetical protein SUGI_0858930 [Cryptomeria japonica]
MAGGDGAPCGACKFLRRKCVKGCVFAPYFSTEELGAAHFAAIHKIFGASNFSKLLQHIPSEEERFDAVVSISYEAQARLQDPIYGCVSHIFALQHQVAHLQAELSFANARLAGNSGRTLLSPHHQNQYGEISTSSVNSSHGHYNLSNELQSNHRSESENTGFRHGDKSSNLLMQMQDYYHNPLSATQQKDVFHDNINPLEACPEHGGDLQALAFSLLRSRS